MNLTRSLMKHLNRLILGSQSPRRKELLEKAGFTFKIEMIDFDESFPKELPSLDVAEYLAIEKNKAYRESFNDEVIITADTVVISNDRILGKPEDRNEAIKMLSLLSDTSHSVTTGVCISDAKKQHVINSSTEVKVKTLSIKEIDYYVDNFSPFDKAGAYGIQEWFGLIAVEWIKGSFFNVVGLPIDQVYSILKSDFGISPVKN